VDALDYSESLYFARVIGDATGSSTTPTLKNFRAKTHHNTPWGHRYSIPLYYSLATVVPGTGIVVDCCCSIRKDDGLWRRYSAQLQFQQQYEYPAAAAANVWGTRGLWGYANGLWIECSATTRLWIVRVRCRFATLQPTLWFNRIWCQYVSAGIDPDRIRSSGSPSGSGWLVVWSIVQRCAVWTAAKLHGWYH
jgi:hypothetical protein